MSFTAQIFSSNLVKIGKLMEFIMGRGYCMMMDDWGEGGMDDWGEGEKEQ